MVNDGWHEQEYRFGDDTELNERLTRLINEMCHVFRAHVDGHWKSDYKPRYVAAMAKELEAKPSLIRKLIALKDPVVRNITYAAIEFNENKQSGETDK